MIIFPPRLRNIPASKIISAQIEAWGGRRFLMCMIVQFSANILVWWSKIDGGEYVAIVLGITGVYVAGNTFQKKEQINAGNILTDTELKSLPTNPTSKQENVNG